MAEDPVTGNYLRVRGEYERWIMAISFAMELPPRARRIPISAEHLMDYYGTTSACAENTFFFGCLRPNCGTIAGTNQNLVRVGS